MLAVTVLLAGYWVIAVTVWYVVVRCWRMVSLFLVAAVGLACCLLWQWGQLNVGC